MTKKRRLASSALWPMGDTEDDIKDLQQMLSSQSSAKRESEFVENSIMKMFERDEVKPRQILDNKTYIYD